MSTPAKMRGLAASSSGYLASQLFLITAGFISMPILTRLLSRDEYGLLSLVLASIGILATVGRLGFPQATTRFYAERSAQGERPLRDFCDAMIGGALFSSAAVVVVALVAADLIADDQPAYARCLRLATIVVATRVVSNVMQETYRAQDRVLAYSAAQIAARYSTLGLAVVFLLTRSATAYQIILATVIGEVVVAAACAADLTVRGVIRRPRFSWAAIKTATVYGAPLAAAGSAGFILEYGDRFLIERFLGLDAVAIYAVPYDITGRLAIAVFSPVRLAVIPMIFRLWTHEGEEATSQFVSEVLTYLVALAVPLATLLLIVNRDLIEVLASSRYGDSASLTPYLLPGILLGELTFMIGAGLTIRKNTAVLAGATFVSAVLNVVLNVLLLPLLGLRGAALATTAAFGLQTGVIYLKSRRVLALRVRWAVVGRAVVAAALMATLLLALGPLTSLQIADLAARGILGVVVAAGCMTLLDPDIRRHMWARLR